MPPPGPRIAVRLGDPLRREFLDDLRRRTSLPGFLIRELRSSEDELLIGVTGTSDPALLLVARIPGDDTRWAVVQPLRSPAGDLVDLFVTQFRARGHSERDAEALAVTAAHEFVVAVVGALESAARLRPERRATLRDLAATIRTALADRLGDEATLSLEARSAGQVIGLAERAGDTAWSEDARDADYDGADQDTSRGISVRPGTGEESRGEDDALPLAAARSFAPPRPTPTTRRRGRVRRLAGTGLAVTVIGMTAAAIALTPEPAPPPRADAAESRDYTVQFHHRDGTPVRLDPCHTYEYEVYPGSIEPAVAGWEVGAAFAALEEASGIPFRFAGFTEERFPGSDREGDAPRYPILVSFEHPSDSEALVATVDDHGVVGDRPLGGLALSGPVSVDGGRLLLAGGAVVVNKQLSETERRWVLLHELGHLAGLGHVSDPDQVMAARLSASGPAAYGSGDRAGLAALGSEGGCVLSPEERERLFRTG